MDAFANILERDYGLKPQGKPAPMSSSSSTSVQPASFPSALGNDTNRRSRAPVLSDDDPFFGTNDARSSSSGKHSSLSGSDLLGGGYDDVFGGPPTFTSTSYNFEYIFRVYDDDIFGGLPAIKSGDSAVEDVFNVGSTSGRATTSASYDDLLGGFGSNEAKDTNTNTDAKPSYDLPLAADSAVDDLLPGFGTSKPPQPAGEQKDIPQRDGSAVNLMEDPFSVFESESTRNSDPAASSSANPDVFEAPAENFGRKDEVNTAPAGSGQQQSNGVDLEQFFKSTARPTSALRQRTKDTSTFPPVQQLSEGPWRSTGAPSNVKKVPSMPSMVDDLTSIFGGVPLNPGDFQEIEGEPADWRKARWERYQRTLQRAAKALEEKHQRDLQIARDQDETHRAGQIVDAEIKGWAAGKERNLRALLSTLQYVLWPECGWQAVSLTDLIMAAAVKKVYWKALLYVHPDKVQQKTATNQQKYIAEKVFACLKEAWNKFESEELL